MNPVLPDAQVARGVADERIPAAVPLWAQPDWAARFPWLVQGTTGRGNTGQGWDFGLAGEQPVGEVLERWKTLREELKTPTAVHSRQVHGAEIGAYSDFPERGLLITEGFDGHAVARPGLLLTVTVADCVPVFIVDAERRAVGLLHAGWRGVAAGIVERGIQQLRTTFSSDPIDLWLHAGPAICGECYEVGPEVHRAVIPEATSPAVPTPIDLRAAISRRAAERGVPSDQLSTSTLCTRCGPPHFFSHRGGSPARQLGVLALRL